MYASNLAGTRYVFPDLKALLAAATPFRSGDHLAGVAAKSAEAAGDRPLHPGRPAAFDLSE